MGSVSWKCREAISRGRVEAVCDLIAGREPNAQRAWERARSEDIGAMGALFVESYRESVERMGAVVSERLRTVIVHLEIDTNKQTIERRLEMIEGETIDDFIQRVGMCIGIAKEIGE